MAMEEQIRTRAYELWEEAGCPQGQDQAFWFRAATELAQNAMADVPVKKTRTRKPAVRKAAAA